MEQWDEHGKTPVFCQRPPAPLLLHFASDMTPVREQIELLLRMKPVRTLGHVYSSSKANAVTLAKIAKQICKQKGI
ncbi:MAG: ABC transporter substrate binding protein, partial [Desulfobacteraceae bacterium]